MITFPKSVCLIWHMYVDQHQHIQCYQCLKRYFLKQIRYEAHKYDITKSTQWKGHLLNKTIFDNLVFSHISLFQWQNRVTMFTVSISKFIYRLVVSMTKLWSTTIQFRRLLLTHRQHTLARSPFPYCDVKKFTIPLWNSSLLWLSNFFTGYSPQSQYFTGTFVLYE